ncbi:unnamed protein product [Lactuca virosa]|uniref:Uncharacterized protein n=1 Tax=Lactuca virosa TaxID=75947 RepID=A0AAU9NIJ8_9ASTR|nr:unnamed protein product [Lactuca virosa]
MRGRYQRKLEHRVVPLYETLPPPRRLGVVTSAPPQPVGSSTASESQPGPHTVVTPAATSRPPVEPITDNAVDSKTKITATVRQVAEKRKAVKAMIGPAPEGSSGPIGQRVMQRRGLMYLLSSASSHSGDVLVIPDDDVQQSEGIGGASHQPEHRPLHRP